MKEFTDAMKKRTDFVEDAIDESNTPEFCKKHKPCNNKILDFTQEEILTRETEQQKSRVNQTSLNTELKKHLHPTSRMNKETNKGRTVPEAKEELLAHYKHQHQKAFLIFNQQKDQIDQKDY